MIKDEAQCNFVENQCQFFLTVETVRKTSRLESY